MSTREIKPGMIVNALGPNNNQGGGAINNGDGTATSQSQVFGFKNAQSNGQWADEIEVQVIAEAGNTGFSVTVERSLDQSRGFQVVATIVNGAINRVSALGGFIRFTAGTATGGPVTVLAVVA